MAALLETFLCSIKATGFESRTVTLHSTGRTASICSSMDTVPRSTMIASSATTVATTVFFYIKFGIVGFDSTK